MATTLLLCLGLIVIICGMIIFFRKRRLYRNGVKATGKVVGIETYTYLTQGPEFNTLYYTGITPIIEVDDNGKKIRVAYCSIEDYSNLSEGDEIEVIYPKDKISELTICNEKGFYKGAMYVVGVGILIGILGLVLLLV